MASSSKLRHAASVSNTGAPAALPADALFEVLLRVPAKDLCCLRAVCRSWRALTSNPHFAAEHKSHHAEPLFALTFRDGDVRGVAIVSLSGQILRRIPIASDRIFLLPTHLDRLCVTRVCKPSLAAWVLNPATAAALALPGLHSDESVASTGDYKVLRISHPDCSQQSHHPNCSHQSHPDCPQQSQLCDIVTLDGRSDVLWRIKQNPPTGLMKREIMKCIALNGTVYFFFDYAVMEPTSIAPFNLDTEMWMPTLRGPETLRSADFWVSGRELSLANLNDSLVIVDSDVGVSLDLWFLMEHKRGLWVKKYRLSVVQDCFYARPLLILDDGRIVIHEREKRLLQCYNPTTDSLADVLDIIAMGLGETLTL